MAYGDVLLSAETVNGWFVLEIKSLGTNWMAVRAYKPSGRPRVRGRYASFTVMLNVQAVRDGHGMKHLSADDCLCFVEFCNGLAPA